jgi:predicted N-acetyltransferase YhbS
VVTVDYLADHPAALPRAVVWLHRQWLGKWGYSRRQAATELRGRLSRVRLPLTLVALNGERPVGIASLVELERPDAATRGCCLSGVYVSPVWRGKGIGRLLCQRAAAEAARLQFPSIGLFTQEHEAFYAEMGWRRVMDAVPPRSGERGVVAFMELAFAREASDLNKGGLAFSSAGRST